MSFEPSINEYLYDVCWSPFRPAVFTCVGNKGLVYIYDLTESKQFPVIKLDREMEKYDDQANTDERPRIVPGVKLSFNPKQRDFLACGYVDGVTKVYKLNFSLSNLKMDEIKTLNHFIEENEKDM